MNVYTLSFMLPLFFISPVAKGQKRSRWVFADYYRLRSEGVSVHLSVRVCVLRGVCGRLAFNSELYLQIKKKKLNILNFYLLPSDCQAIISSNFIHTSTAEGRWLSSAWRHLFGGSNIITKSSDVQDSSNCFLFIYRFKVDSAGLLQDDGIQWLHYSELFVWFKVVLSV